MVTHAPGSLVWNLFWMAVIAIPVLGAARGPLAWVMVVLARRDVAILVLHGRYQPGYKWPLRTTQYGGSLVVDEFAGARFFAAPFESINPAVKVVGIWPMGPPELPANARQVRS